VFDGCEEGWGGWGVEEGGEGGAETGEGLEGVLAVAEGDGGGVGGLVVLGRLVGEKVEVLLGEEAEVGAFVLGMVRDGRGKRREPEGRSARRDGERRTYRETGPETEVLVNRRSVEAFEVGERPVVGLADQSRVVVDVFCLVSRGH